MTSRFFKKLWRLLPGVVAVLITVSLSQLSAFTPLESLAYRSFFQIRGNLPWDDRIALITIDDATLAQLGQFPLARDNYTQLLKQLSNPAPAVIAFNILFVDPNPVDEALAEVIDQSGNVVLAAAMDDQGHPLTPVEPLQEAAISIGHIHRPLASDGLVHQIMPVQAHQIALGIQIAAVYSENYAPIELPSFDSPFMINWLGSSNNLPQYSFADVLVGRIPPSTFHNKIVLIGMNATGVDALPTPFDTNPPGSGLLLHATVLDNVLQKRSLQPIVLRNWWVLMLATMPLISYWIVGRPLCWQLVIATVGCVSWWGLCLLLFYNLYWPPVVPPLVLWGLTSFGAIFSQQLWSNFALQHLLNDLWHHYRQNIHLTLRPLASYPSIPDDLSPEVHKLALLANYWGWAQATQAAITQTAPVGILAADDQTQIWFCNALAMQWLQIQTGDSLTSILVPQWFSDSAWKVVLEKLWRAEDSIAIECQHNNHWFELRFERLESDFLPNPLIQDGRQGILLLVENITPRKTVELRLRFLNEGLEDEVRQRAEALEQTNLTLMQEITERKQVQEQLAYQALHDELTGLPNRLQFKTQLAELIEQSKKEKDVLFAVLFIDCDRFKLVNDSFGHLVGDKLLKAIAHRLRHCLAKTDLVSRFGGDEFTLLIKDMKDARVAVIVAQRLRQQLQIPFQIDGRQIYTGCSIGIVLSNSTYEQADEMLRDADTAMYRAKRSGIGFTIFEPEMHQAVQSCLQLETDLRRSLHGQELIVYYQPIFDIETYQIVGFEALLRWQHPQIGIVAPDRFIPIAEETGMIIDIGQWVMREACMQLRYWQEKRLLSSDTFMSVNLSVQQFNEQSLLARVDQTLQETRLESQCLKLEITESAIMANSDLAIKTFHNLKDRGIRLGIDDFGTGYSSLNYLHCFPIDVLKVDRAFIQRMVEGRKHLSLVQAIRTLAHHFDMTMVAEGIETETQIRYLKAMNCSLGQGYFFCPPLDSQTLELQCLSASS